jgi:hypothetical protein
VNRAGLLAATFATTALCGCIDPPGEPALSSTAGISFEEYRATAAREPGTGNYIVDWDLVLPGEQALHDHWSRYQHGALTIYAIDNVDIKWSAADKLSLRYCVGGSFGANQQRVVEALQTATAQGWEKLANVHFVHDASQDATCTAANTSVLFDVNLAPQDAGYLARSFFPDSPRAERNLLIEDNSFDPATTGNLALSAILKHELGHALGFRHEHIRAAGNPCPEDNQYRAVTEYDARSTMHYPQCGSPGNTLELSATDQQGASAIYGPPLQNASPMTSITAPLGDTTVAQSFTVDAAVIDTDLVRAELYIDAALSQTRIAGPFEFSVKNLSPGAHTLELRGIDAANQISKAWATVIVVPGAGGPETDVTGGCSTGGDTGLLLGLGLLGLTRRRR